MSGFDNEWIEWAGGECPVAAGMTLSLRFRNGIEWLDDCDDYLDWSHTDNPMDIIAYRVVRA